MASQIYQAAKSITATNYISTDASYKPWVDAILSCSQESTYIYGRKMELIAYNNRWGTMNGSTPADHANVHTVFQYLSRTYSGTEGAIRAITDTYRFHCPGFFELEVLNCMELKEQLHGLQLGLKT